MALIVLDASLVIAHLTLADVLHERTLGYLEEHAADDLRLPASAYAEVLVEPARTSRIDTTRRLLDDIAVAIEPLTQDIAERAAALRAEHRSLRLPDALVLATGDVLDADEVATADRRWRRFDRVRVLT